MRKFQQDYEIAPIFDKICRPKSGQNEYQKFIFKNQIRFLEISLVKNLLMYFIYLMTLRSKEAGKNQFQVKKKLEGVS